MSTRRFAGSESESTEINISPLIDMVFILLIFFIVTTVFVEERGFGVDKPTAAGARSIEKQSIVFVLTGNGQILHDGAALGTGGVAATVRRLTRREQLPVIIDVQRGALSNLVVRVIDEARVAGAQHISLTSSN
jgi:biopolymer transport protein ExbD